jgi:hypothetical protein
MSFELPDVVKILITNANPRRELHGEDKVRAIDLSFSLTGENHLLDLIQPGLREHHYCNTALKAGQEPLPGMVIPLPNLRFPRLPLAYHFAKGEKWRGYRLIRDFGIDEERFDFTDVVLAGIQYELAEGGSVTVKGTIQYNGDELDDNDTYGMLSGLASEGEIHIRLLAPAELVAVKKGYRAGRPDTPAANTGDDGQGDLGDGDGDDAGDGDPITPEEALAGSLRN